MKTLVSILFLLFCLSEITANGQTVRNISMENGPLPRLIDFVNAEGKPFQPDSLSSDSLKIVSVFQDEGYFDCQVAVNYRISPTHADLSFIINRGPRYLLSVTIAVSGSDSVRLFDFDELSQDYTDLPATSANIEKLAMALLERAANAGYPYAEIGFGDFQQIPENRLRVTAIVNPGPKVTIHGLNFPGRHLIDQAFLETYCLFQPGIVYSNKRMRSIARRLNGAAFLKSIGQPKLKFSSYPQNGVIELPITERPALQIEGMVGIASKTKKLFGKADAMISNIFGRGRQLKMEWSRKDEYSSNKELGYFEPSVMNWPVNVQINAFQFDYDSLYIETGLRLTLELTTVSRYAYRIGFGAAQISAESYGRNIIPPKDKLDLLLGFYADNRDYSDNPRRGEVMKMDWRFFFENRHDGGMIDSSGDSYRQIEIMAGKFAPITYSTIVMAQIVGKAIFGDKSVVDRQFSLGGAGSLRGFDQDVFRASRYAVATIEYRYLYHRDGRAYIFADLAGINMKSILAHTPSETLFKTGFGAGIASRIAPGMAILEIGFPAGENVTEARIHFAIRTEFD